MISTREIKMEPKKMFSVLFMQNGAKALIIACGGIIIFLVLGIVVSYKFFILCLIWLFFISPMEIAFLYFYYGMQPLTTFNTIPHIINFSESEIEIHFITPNPEEREKELEQKIDRKYNLQKKEFTSMKTGPDFVLLFFGDKGWIWIPVNSFNTFDDFKGIVNSFHVNVAS